METGTDMGPRLADQICFALYSTSGAVTQAYAGLLRPLQLTYPQFVVMMALWERDGLSVTELGRRVGLSKATLTPILQKLEQTGYLRRETAPDNARRKRLLLTPRGRALAAEGERVATAALCATGLSECEVETLLRLCNQVKSKLGDDAAQTD